MTIQAGLWTGTAIALAVAVVAGVMDWRRNRRPDFDEVGWVPWRGIQVTGFFAALAFAIFAMHA